MKKYAIRSIRPLFSKITDSVRPPNDNHTMDPVHGPKTTFAGATPHKIAPTVNNNPDIYTGSRFIAHVKIAHAVQTKNLRISREIPSISGIKKYNKAGTPIAIPHLIINWILSFFFSTAFCASISFLLVVYP